MGLRAASVRHPHVMVMAPALTKTIKLQNFKPSLNPTSKQNVYDTLDGDSSLSCEFHSKPVTNVQEGNSFNNINVNQIMNSSPLHMGDHKDKMGLQKAGLVDDIVISSYIKTNNTNSSSDMEVNDELLFNNMETVLPDADIVQNVDELMQVIKSIESANANELGTDSEAIFPLSTSDLTSNLTSLEKELFNDVDVMNISMDEQLIEGTSNYKENHAKELIDELQRKQTKLERKLDFILRRLRKLQAKQMGQHVSEEISGIFEHVHRILRKTKDNVGQGQAMAGKYLESGVVENSESVGTERLKPISEMSARNLVRKLEFSTTLQANASGRQRQVSRYFGSGSVETNSSARSALLGATVVPQWTTESKAEMQRAVGLLQAETSLVQEQLDSEATVSSSGGESCDEMQTFANPHQQYLAIQKRASWRYATERAAIAARWTWLQAQIADLEYRIRQYSELHKQIRANKGALILGGASPPRSLPTSPSAVNGYRGQLPGSSPSSLKSLDSTANGAMSNAFGSARTRPLVNFRKRKLLQTWGLHAVSKKAARSSTLRCGCTPPALQCALCTGRTDPTRPRDLADYLSKSERIALLDSSFHPVFTLPEDASASIHLEAIMKIPEWQQRSSRPNMKSVKYINKTERLGDKCNASSLEQQPKKQPAEHRRKYTRMIRPTTINALSAKIKSKFRGRKPGVHSLSRLRRKRHSEKSGTSHYPHSALDDNAEDFEHAAPSSSNVNRLDSRSSSPLLSTQTISSYKRNSRVSSYDIDNIVIPYSVAAATRVEKLQYKEILTPKWRMVDTDFVSNPTVKNNGSVNEQSQDSDTEDFSAEAMLARHEKSEHDEKRKFLNYLMFPYGYGRSRSHKRTDSRAESSGCNSPDRVSPHLTDSLENTVSPLISPPATPLSICTDEPAQTNPQSAAFRRRTVSQSRAKEKDAGRDEIRCPTPTESVEVIPYDRRSFPLNDETYDRMLKLMPENHQFQTNVRARDYHTVSPVSYLDEKVCSPGSESTESALGEEDPNDPEWIDLESIKERYRR